MTLRKQTRPGSWWRRAASSLLIAGGATAQEPPTVAPPTVALPAIALPGWQAEPHEAARPALRASCEAIGRLPADAPLGGTSIAADWAEFCAAIATRRPLRDILERLLVAQDHGEGRLTGYYEPELHGAPQPEAAFPTPLHARPPTPVAASRAQIQDGALAGRGLELVWVDPVDAFFLHIQGSGRVIMPDGRVLRLGYAGANGHPYVPIGRILIQRGEIAREAMSMQAIRAWLAAARPEDARALLRANPSYIFFQELPLAPDQGPIGTLGVPLTPRHSIAVDRAHVPLGAPVFILGETGLPRLMVAQDTGGAIRGRARGDAFWGWGDAAGDAAGPMNLPIRMFVLVPPAAMRGSPGTPLAQPNP